MSVIDQLIYNRTEADLNRAAELNRMDYAKMTEAEKAEFNSGLRGSYTPYIDMNRVTEAMEYLKTELEGYGYKVNYSPVYIKPGRTQWIASDLPTPEQLTSYLSNVSAIRAVLEVFSTTPSVPETMQGLTYERANDIEKILADVETIINGIKRMFRVCGTFYAGSGYQLQLFSRGR